ncbi:MAG: RNA methyltransferase [Alphaproteobacteria bacterium]|nr:RNA methyltransferase [Alphaproteobacteria bacterium]
MATVTHPTDTGGTAGKDHGVSAPEIILVHPQIGENIGTAARAMLNCGLVNLRLVKPREAWPNEKAITSSSGAKPVLDGARLYETTADAVADLHRLYAATARPRDMVKPVLSPRAAAAEMRAEANLGRKVGILFGAERSGLDNDDLTLADAIIEVPANPKFSSLNLAQAVLICAYEWRMAAMGVDGAAPRRGRPRAEPASKGDMAGFYAHLEAELDRAGFLYPSEKRPRMVRNIRNLFARADLTEQEVRTLRGVIAALVKGRGN